MKSKTPKALIIDDEPDIRELLKITLGRMNIETYTAPDIATAKQLLNEHHFNITLVDLRLPDGSGLDFIYYMQQIAPSMPITMITAYGTMEIAIDALKKGAFDFIVKPVDITVLRNMVKSALQVSMQDVAVQQHNENALLGNSAAIVELRKNIEKLSHTQAPIMITGPSGSGKELVAQQIHTLGPRMQGPFIAVNCGAISPELMESEFFGHKKGSFTGAVNDKIGLFQAAENGTLFLDEITELPLNMQVKLLRAIQERSIRAVGDVTEYPVNVRILSATNKNLRHAVTTGAFREDLYYRINVIEIVVPSLQQHAEDIPLLTQHFLKNLSQLNNVPIPTISSDALEALQSYNFPGNIRELENIIERAMAMYEGQKITLHDLQLPQLHDHVEDTFVWGEDNIDQFSSNIERNLILKALHDCDNDKIKAAAMLQISIRALRYKLKKLGLAS